MSLEEEPSSLIADTRDTSEAGASEPPDSDEFSDGECGEPLAPQRLLLDFAPGDEDTEEAQQKCCEFWQFVSEQPELEALGMLPDLEISEEISEASDDDVSSLDEPRAAEPSSSALERTAVSMLELVEDKGLIDRAFESRLPTSHCSIGLADYAEQPADAAQGEHAATSAALGERSSAQATTRRRPARALCRRLQQWDDQHPKSMAPPGPAPLLALPTEPAAARKPRQCRCSSVCRVQH